ncbi:methyltransferase [Acrocarpospora phusangensis]|nr:methyltransferase [Acrocarpospora phusangensis]
MAIRVAATLRIADHITQGTATAADLAKITDTHPDALERLLRHLVHARILTCDQDRYALTSGGETLRDDHPGGLRPMLDVTSMVGRADLAFVHLLHSIRTGEPSFPRQYGRDFWEDAAGDPARSLGYDTQMGVDVSGDAPAIVGAFDWGSLTHIMDVGGGNGTLLAAILTAHPHLRGTVFDQPGTAAAARETLTRAGLADRADTVGGSFFDPIPQGPDGYLLSAIIHDWDDPSSIAILRRCAEAATPGASVFVIEKIGADGESISTGMDLRVLVYMAGKERTVTQLTALATEAGLRLHAVHPAGDCAILQFTPAAQ